MTEIAEVSARAAALRAKLNEEEELLVKRLAEVRAEREDLEVAERVWERMRRLLDVEEDERQAEPAVPAQVGGRGVLLVPHRGPDTGEDALPTDYQRLMGIVREAAGPVKVKEIGRELGLDIETKGKLEPLRSKVRKLAERGWLRKLPDGSFLVRP
ncbi:hypothetical protein [Streptomyces sp. NPDC058297]|uniref:hypothetical protein n=1 Tax=Streptomyces sp. NPDC058297 TaxID=3346433 RepID=UPI0036E2A3D3